MKIKKVDDKPMIIHTKQKARLHSHEQGKSGIKDGTIYTVDKSPKIREEAADKKSKSNGAAGCIKEKSRNRYHRSMNHETGNVRENAISRFKRTVRESNQSVKTRETNLHIAGRTGAAGAKAATDQMEGGREMQEAACYAYEAARPVTGTASKGAEFFKKKAVEAKKMKKVEAGKKLAKKSVKKAAKETAKGMGKEAAKTVAKTATTAAASAAGTAAAPGAGTAIGIAAGYAAGIAVEEKDTQITNRNRKIKFFLDKMKAEEKQQDSVAKLIKDLIKRKAMLWVKAAAPVVGIVFLLLVLMVAVVAIPIVAVVGVLYNSPFAIFLPPLENGDTVPTVASAYMAEFNRDVTTLANDHTGYDDGRIIYVDYEGVGQPGNYYDILAVYMVKHGIGDTATVMNDTSKGWLKTVADDMCSYTISSGMETVEGTDADGNPTSETKTFLYVNVTLKTWRDMVSVYGFGSDEQELLAEFMKPEYLACLGYSPGNGGSMQSTLTEAEISSVLSDITDSIHKNVCDYALHRVGYPYSQDLRDSGNYYDCSSLAYYSWKSAGIDISFGGETTAAAEAQGLNEAGKSVSFETMKPGDLIFYSTSANGRYKNITHVAVYAGNGKAVEALNEKYGVVYRDMRTANIVLICRPD